MSKEDTKSGGDRKSGDTPGNAPPGSQPIQRSGDFDGEGSKSGGSSK